MEVAVKVIAGAILIVGGMFVLVLLSALIGGFAGWAVGLFFADSLAAVKHLIGVDITNFQLGVMLGFVGGFFKTSVSSSST